VSTVRADNTKSRVDALGTMGKTDPNIVVNPWLTMEAVVRYKVPTSKFPSDGIVPLLNWYVITRVLGLFVADGDPMEYGK